MKKVFLLFLCALTICTLFILPASAAETDEIVLVYDSFQVCELAEPLASGTYSLTFDYADASLTDFGSDSVAISSDGGYYDISFDGMLMYELGLLYEPDGSYFAAEFITAGQCPDFADCMVTVTFTPIEKDGVTAGASIWDVLTGAGNYISESLSSATALFYNAETAALTPVGTLSLVAVAIGLAILIVALLRNYLQLG